MYVNEDENKLLYNTLPQTSSFVTRITSGFIGVYASPRGLSYAWGGGRILGFALAGQIVTGWIITLVYAPSVNEAFAVVDHLNREVWGGAILHILHLVGASVFFALLFFHVGRGLVYGGPRLASLWLRGVVLLGVGMLTAFLGYTLPWGQISFWGATVITSLVSTLPVVGGMLVVWLWGGYRVGSAALLLFFTAHYTLPLVMLCLVIVHLILLHRAGSHTQLGVVGSGGLVPFSPYYTMKDRTSFGLLCLFSGVGLCYPWAFADTENWAEADPLSRPVHIQPEWYFLFAYAILRAVPNKLGGVIALVLRVGVLALLPLGCARQPRIDQLTLIAGGVLLSVWVLLTWLGGCPVESPFLGLRQFGGILYFVCLMALGVA